MLGVDMDAEYVAETMNKALSTGGTARGDSRTPKFGEWMRGIWASEKNPIRDGQYVRTVKRTGRLNPGTFYELTDGKGKFWNFPANATVFIDTPNVKVTGRRSAQRGGNQQRSCWRPG